MPATNTWAELENRLTTTTSELESMRKQLTVLESGAGGAQAQVAELRDQLAEEKATAKTTLDETVAKYKGRLEKFKKSAQEQMDAYVRRGRDWGLGTSSPPDPSYRVGQTSPDHLDGSDYVFVDRLATWKARCNLNKKPPLLPQQRPRLFDLSHRGSARLYRHRCERHPRRASNCARYVPRPTTHDARHTMHDA